MGRDILNKFINKLTNDIRIKKESKYYYIIKRTIDILGSLIGIVFFVPLFIIISIIIKIESKGTVLFVQKRCGQNEKIFNMYKFRSMRVDAEEILEKIKHLNEVDGPMFKIKEDPRLTRIGKILRKTSIDELPQLINVLKGEMSLVGPRPPIDFEVKRYAEWQKIRLSVKPGLTGLWQISGRSNLGFEKMVLLDLIYIRDRNIFYDIKIILKTIPILMNFDGAY